MPTPARPAPLERALTALGAAGLVVGVAVLLLAPEPPLTKGPGPAPLLPALSMLIPGLLLVVGSVRTVVGGWRVRSWPRAAGVVVEARPVGAPYVYVRCRYTVGGADHQVDEVRYGLRGSAAFREGAPAGVRYDPVEPSQAALEPTFRPVSAAALTVGVVAVGLSASLLALG